MIVASMEESATVFLIHATPVSIEPINKSFEELWPEARVCNLLDDSLTADLQAAGGLNQEIINRFLVLAGYAENVGAEGVLFTCSAFGGAIERCKEKLRIPVLKPNEAMIEDAVTQGKRLALIATFEPALGSIINEIASTAAKLGREVTVEPYFVPGAMQALHDGDRDRHDDLIAKVAARAAGCDLICFGQFSMTGAAKLAAQVSGRRVLTTPDSAVRRLRTLILESRGRRR